MLHQHCWCSALPGCPNAFRSLSTKTAGSAGGNCSPRRVASCNAPSSMYALSSSFCRWPSRKCAASFSPSLSTKSCRKVDMLMKARLRATLLPTDHAKHLLPCEEAKKPKPELQTEICKADSARTQVLVPVTMPGLRLDLSVMLAHCYHQRCVQFFCMFQQA